ncbi:MAG: hypothetical protein CVU89_11445 [Firmicutes bacterium HGW-Firmicutes-14]|nr:MAG: hypothetical protein CVU89_11445 [Firmicutes bacterium HGW-Firmicutes-14]
MERLTGIVMEKTKNHVVMMTEKGEFKRVRVSGRIPDIGEEIRIPVVHRRFLNLPRASWMAVAAAVLLLLVTSPLLIMINQPHEFAVASVSIDINPSIGLTVSNLNNVMDAHAYNSGGKKVLDRVNPEGVSINKAVAMITGEAVELGFIGRSGDNTVLISVVPLSDANIDKNAFEKTLLASANDVLTGSKISGNIQTLHVPADIGETAKKKGISPGKYAVLIEAVNDGLDLTEEDIKEKSITVAIAGAGGEPDRIIGQARVEEQFGIKEKIYFEIASSGRKDVSIAGGTSSGGQDSEIEAGQPGSDSEPDSERRYIDPIRRDGEPEKPRNTGNTGHKPPVAAVSVPSDQKDETTGGAVYDSEQNDIGTVPDNSPESQDTVDNYMGAENPGNKTGDNEDMYILRPNF